MTPDSTGAIDKALRRLLSAKWQRAPAGLSRHLPAATRSIF
jgi:hypothetical protein